MRVISMILLLLPLVLIATGCGRQAPDKNPEAAMSDQNVEKETRKFAVEGMHCAGCENRLVFVMEKLPQVAEAKASYEEKTLEVVVDKNLSDDEIIAKIREAELTPGERIENSPL